MNEPEGGVAGADGADETDNVDVPNEAGGGGSFPDSDGPPSNSSKSGWAVVSDCGEVFALLQKKQKYWCISSTGKVWPTFHIYLCS